MENEPQDDVETEIISLPAVSDVLDRAAAELDEVDERLRTLDSADR